MCLVLESTLQPSSVILIALAALLSEALLNSNDESHIHSTKTRSCSCTPSAVANATANVPRLDYDSMHASSRVIACSPIPSAGTTGHAMSCAGGCCALAFAMSASTSLDACAARAVWL